MDDRELVFPETGMTARDEIRVSGFGLLRCPSCGELAAELVGRHCLILSWGDTIISSGTWMGYPIILAAKGTPWCECRDGQRVTLDLGVTGYETVCAAVNIHLADTVMFADRYVKLTERRTMMGRTLAYVTTWAQVKEGDTVLIGWPPKWRTVTAITVAEGVFPARYLRTDNPPDPDGYREYWAQDGTLIPVRDDIS